MVARKKAANSHAFIHQEVVVLSDKANLEVISLEQPLVCVIEQSEEDLGHSKAQEQSKDNRATLEAHDKTQEVQGHLEAQGLSNINVTTTLNIPTPAVNEKGTKRAHVQMEGMDVDSHSSSKRSKTLSRGKDIVIFNLEESNSQTKQGGEGGCLIQEERSHQIKSFDASSFEQRIPNFHFSHNHQRGY